MNSSASSWQPVTSTIGFDSGMILFHIFISVLDDQTECIFSKFEDEDGVDGNILNDSKTSSHKEFYKLESGVKIHLMVF